MPPKGWHPSEESRAKMSESQKKRFSDPEELRKCSERSKGHVCTQEQKEKAARWMTGKRVGDKNPNYGKHLSNETKIKMSNALSGKKFTDEHRLKLSDSKKGEKNPMFKKSKENPFYGKTHSDETKLKISNSRKGKCVGPENKNWNGGSSFEPYCPKWTKDLRVRIRTFFDNHCVLCGKDRSCQKKELSCHHVEYNKTACCDGKPVQFAALCGKCHAKTNIDRPRWEAMLHRIIDEIYGGRSYYTKEEYIKMRGGRNA